MSAFREKTTATRSTPSMLTATPTIRLQCAGSPMSSLPKLLAAPVDLRFYFASAADKKEFDKNPSKYAPAYGGFCVNHLRKDGRLVNGDPNVFFVYKGKLYFCSEKKGAEEFKKNIDQNLDESYNRWRQLFGS